MGIRLQIMRYRLDRPLLETGSFILKTAHAKIIVEATAPNSVKVTRSGQWHGEEAKQLTEFLFKTCRQITGTEQKTE